MDFMDQAVLNFFVANRVEWLSFLMLIITYSGSYILAGGLTILSFLSFFIHKHKASAISLLISVGGSLTSVFILKNILQKARPLTEALYLESSSSFPSGHATIAMALYGFILYTLWKHNKHHLKNPLIIFLAILIPLIGLSRLYLGVHYLSDVLVGYIIGFIWVVISLYIKKKLNRR